MQALIALMVAVAVTCPVAERYGNSWRSYAAFFGTAIGSAFVLTMVS